MEDRLDIREVHSLDGVSEKDCLAWDRLVQNQPMRTTTWLLTWWKHFQTDNKELSILLFYEDSELVGVAPLYVDVVGNRRIYRLLGDTGDVCTDHNSWFAKPGYETRVGCAVGEYFLQNKRWDRLHLLAVDEADATNQALLAYLGPQQLPVHKQGTLNCWTLPIPESWDDYLSVLSKSHRKRCRRLVRSYFDSDRVAIHEATRETYEDVWRVFLNLHALRWGSPERPDGSFSNRRFRAFHEDVSRAFLEQDRLRLCYMTCDDQPIAAEYQFFDGDTLYAYQSGIALDSGERQPGNLSLIATIQFCIERGITSLDLLRGDEPYKAHWRASPAACQDLRIWPDGIANVISAKLQMGFLDAKQAASSWWHRSSESS